MYFFVDFSTFYYTKLKVINCDQPKNWNFKNLLKKLKIYDFFMKNLKNGKISTFSRDFEKF